MYRIGVTLNNVHRLTELDIHPTPLTLLLRVIRATPDHEPSAITLTTVISAPITQTTTTTYTNGG